MEIKTWINKDNEDTPVTLDVDIEVADPESGIFRSYAKLNTVTHSETNLPITLTNDEYKDLEEHALQVLLDNLE